MSQNDGDAPAAEMLARIVTAATGSEIAELPGDTRLVGTHSDGDDGSEPVSHAAGVLEDASSVIGVVPRVDAAIARRLLTVADDGTEARLVITGRALEAVSGVGALGIRTAVADRDIELFAHSGSVGDAAGQDDSEAARQDDRDAARQDDSEAARQDDSEAAGCVGGEIPDDIGTVDGGDSPLTLLLVDDRALVGLFHGGELAAVLSTTDPAVREWVVESFGRYRAASAPLFE